MPGLENRPSKLETSLVHERKKKELSNNVKVKQRIRVIYTDPDATDCSSDDEKEGWNKMNSCSDGAERLVKEVCVIRNTSRKDGNGRGTSKHAGVRRRPWGKWVAEIRDPFTGKKNWLGTYLTEDEAVSAYQKKKLKFDNYNRNIGVVTSSETSTCEEINTNVIISLPSPSSVLNQPDEPLISCANSVYFGNYVEHFFDDVRVEDLPMCELNDVGVMEIPTIDIDISSSDIAWIDELLDTSAR